VASALRGDEEANGRAAREQLEQRQGRQLAVRRLWRLSPLRIAILRMMAVDTTADARAVQIGALRALGGAGRLSQALAMSEQARRISIAGLLGRRPELTPSEARCIVLKRILGEELYQAAYRDDSR
jgi:hypothetical protein